MRFERARSKSRTNLKYPKDIIYVVSTNVDQDLKDFLKRNQLKNGDQHCYIGNKFDIDVDVKPIQYLAQLFSSFQIEENLKFFKRFPFH